MHNKTTWNENYLKVNPIIGIIGIYPRMEMAIMPHTLFMYTSTMREKNVGMYEMFISWLQMYANVIKVLSKGYL